MARPPALGARPGESAASDGAGHPPPCRGTFLFEIPSNLILERVGARLWMARIMLGWGLVSMAMVFVRDALGFYALRSLLGLAERSWSACVCPLLRLRRQERPTGADRLDDRFE